MGPVSVRCIPNLTIVPCSFILIDAFVLPFTYGSTFSPFPHFSLSIPCVLPSLRSLCTSMVLSPSAFTLTSFGLLYLVYVPL
ncbi:hypothetical protein DFP72DRAFT_905677 [Ephemerocybe angulata]|uniref:Uncharacterized protein n=1 Tax=Ephemerocybe angulata TaxID=980116 RepID=A0A8H6HTX7_9AGAR|nr:hypothetical protein DFP72DRAFT_905677 [Tulosesus angulatus]